MANIIFGKKKGDVTKRRKAESKIAQAEKKAARRIGQILGVPTPACKYNAWRLSIRPSDLLKALEKIVDEE